MDGVVEPRQLTTTRSMTDRIFRGGISASGVAVLVIMALVGVFLTIRALQALSQAGLSFITTQAWEPDGGNFGIAAVLTGTFLIAITAIFFAVPLSTGVALYISEYSPRRIRQTLISLVDLMAAVPSVVFGLWGFFFLQGQIIGLARWLSTYLGWIPFFSVDGSDPDDPLSTATVFTSSTFIAGIVVALMVAPITTSVMREVFSQAPVGARGCLRTRCDEVGNDPLRRPALRQRRNDRRHHARPGACTGGDHRGLHDHLAGVPHPAEYFAERHQLHLRADRAALRRGDPLRDVCPHGRRPGSLPHHARCQLHRVVHRRPIALRRINGLAMTASIDDLDKLVSGDPSRRTTLPQRTPTPVDLKARRIGGFRRSDVLSLAGAAVGGVGVAALLFTLLPFSGWMGFLVVSYVAFVGLYAVLVSLDEDFSAVKDRIAAVVIHSLAFALLLALIFVVTFTVIKGWEALTNLNFFTQDMQNAGPLDPLTSGGILHAVAGTLIMITIALAIVIPLGVACAVYMNEIPGPFARFVRTISEAMTALPSIVAGLFIYASLILILGFDKSGLAAALAISVMMLPIIIRASDVVLRLVPGNLKEASYALGAGQWRTVWFVTLPTARSGLMTAIILGTARGIGETSPVLLTAGFTAALNLNPASGPMVSLPLATFEFVKSPEPTMIARGFGTAAVLMFVVLILFIIARIIGGRGAGNLSRNQQRRSVKRSREDSQRFTRRESARVATEGTNPKPSSGTPSLDFGDTS